MTADATGHDETAGNPVTNGKADYPRTNLFDDARDLVAQNAGRGEFDLSFDDVQVCMTYAARDNPDKDLLDARNRQLQELNRHGTADC